MLMDMTEGPDQSELKTNCVPMRSVWGQHWWARGVHNQTCRTAGTTHSSRHSHCTHPCSDDDTLQPPPTKPLHAELCHTYTHTPPRLCFAIVFKCLTKTLRCGEAVTSPSPKHSSHTHRPQTRNL